MTASIRFTDTRKSPSSGSFAAAAISSDPSFKNSSEEDCTICAEPIQDYVPDYFNGVEMNPACDECKQPSRETQIKSDEPKKQTNNFSIEPAGLDYHWEEHQI